MTDATAVLVSARAVTHGDFTNGANIAQQLKAIVWAASAAHPLPTTHAEALDQICTKIARIVGGDPNHTDHWRDIAGYAELVVAGLPRAGGL